MSKTLVILTLGDAEKSTTLSNLPFYLTHTMREKGLDVKNYNLMSNQYLPCLFYKCFNKFMCTFLKNRPYRSYDRTLMCQLICNYKIKRICRKDSDYYLVTNFNFNTKKYSSKPCIMLCDWTIEYTISIINKKKMYFFDMNASKRQKHTLSTNKKNLTIFKEVETYYKDLTEINMKYIGYAFNLPKRSQKKIIDLEKKFNSDYFVFIGSKYYKSTLEKILKACKEIPIKVKVIGINEKDSEDIEYYGYLDKGKKADLDKYIDIIENSKFIINTNEEQSGFTSILEAMYYYTPVITYKSNTILKMFKNFDFCIYSMNEVKDIKKNINVLLNKKIDEYKNMCNSAYIQSKNYSWDVFADNILKYYESGE